MLHMALSLSPPQNGQALDENSLQMCGGINAVKGKVVEMVSLQITQGLLQ